MKPEHLALRHLCCIAQLVAMLLAAPRWAAAQDEATPTLADVIGLPAPYADGTPREQYLHQLTTLLGPPETWPAEPAPAPERCADREPLQLRAGWSIGAPELAMAALGELSDACECGDADACQAIFLTISVEEPSFPLTPDAVCNRWGQTSAACVFQSLVAVTVASFDQHASLAPPEEVAAWCASRGNADVCAAVVMVADPAEDWIGLHDFMDAACADTGGLACAGTFSDRDDIGAQSGDRARRAACQGGSGLACALQSMQSILVLDSGLPASSSWSADIAAGRSLSQVTALACRAHVEFSCRTLVLLDVLVTSYYPDLPTSPDSLAWLADFCTAGDQDACELREAHRRANPPNPGVGTPTD
jgi:hypothetical protein